MAAVVAILALLLWLGRRSRERLRRWLIRRSCPASRLVPPQYWENLPDTDRARDGDRAAEDRD